MPFTIIRQDITKMKVDVIVNAANKELAMGSGVCGAIFKAAGAAQLQSACDKLSPIQTGEAVITPGFQLAAKHIIHTAGPIYHDGKSGETELLYASYRNSLTLAAGHRCTSIAFPLISSGVYRFPKQEALQIATKAIRDFLNDYEMDVYLAVFDKEAFAASHDLLGAVREFIDEHYVDTHRDERRLRIQEDLQTPSLAFSLNELRSEKVLPNLSEELSDLIKQMDEPFSATLIRLIDASGKTDPEVYKRANLDRKLFSKIRNVKGYVPGKRTVIALAVALELPLEDTNFLLRRAGHALAPNQMFDTIIKYFLLKKQYNIDEINEILFQFDQPLLGG